VANVSIRSTVGSALLAVRSLIWVVLLPGIVAGYVPWRYFGLSRVSPSLANAFDVLGLLSPLIGAVVVGICVWEFAHEGRGTLAPVDPPRQLVVRGLYRFVRNPLYLGVTIVLLGQALLTRSGALVLYWAIWFALANLFVILYEEPSLRRRFGASYDAYMMQVNRWIPRLFIVFSTRPPEPR
jgi:protein-S-isoprenylcysteine O-methyltransferase Ste14